MNLNPMGITSGVWPGNYQQPNVSNPAANPAIASTAVGANMLNVSWPITVYVQPVPTYAAYNPAWVNQSSPAPVGVVPAT
jgi:hypothetical protein